MTMRAFLVAHASLFNSSTHLRLFVVIPDLIRNPVVSFTLAISMHRGFRAFTHKLIYPFSHQRIYAHTQPFPAFVPGKSFSLGSQQVRPVSFEMHAADGDFIRDRHIAGRILRRIASDHSPVTVVMLLLFLILYFLLNRRQKQTKAKR
jgi:hypothetical protein